MSYMSFIPFSTVLHRLVFLFFFSSRRRHTRFDCDWSSDVCSSDLRWPCPDDDRYGESLTPGLAGRIHAHHGADGEYAIPRRQDPDAVADGSVLRGDRKSVV